MKIKSLSTITICLIVGIINLTEANLLWADTPVDNTAYLAGTAVTDPSIPIVNEAGGYNPQLNKIDKDMNSGFSSITTELKNLSLLITSLVSGSVNTAAGLMFTLTPNLHNTISANYSNTVSSPTVINNTSALNVAQTGRIFNATQNSPINYLTLSHLSGLIPLPAVNGGDSNNTTQENAAPFSLDTLLGPTNYQDTQDLEARQFIAFSTFQSTPYSNLPPSILRSKNANVTGYKAYLGTYAALQSIGTSNLDWLYTQRQPIAGLGTLAGIPSNNTDASPLQVDEFMAARRALNPEWYQNMETAPPATIARETLYTLAEIRWELYQSKQLMQRLLATDSALELEQTQTAVRPQLNKLENEVQVNFNYKYRSDLQNMLQKADSSSSSVIATMGASSMPSAVPTMGNPTFIPAQSTGSAPLAIAPPPSALPTNMQSN